MNKCFKTLEFNKILEQVKFFCSSSLGEKLVNEMTPFDSYEDIIDKQDETEQARYCFEFVSKDPFDRIDDVEVILKKIAIGGLIQSEDAFSLLSIIFWKSFFTSKKVSIYSFETVKESNIKSV